MFLFEREKETFCCSFALLLLGTAFIAPWQAVEAGNHKNRHNMGHLLAAGLLAAVLSMNSGRGGGGGGGVFARLQGKSNNQHHHQQGQGTILVPVPVPPPHHHHHAMHQSARHPMMMSPAHPAPLFLRGPMLPMPLGWQPNPMHELAALHSFHQFQQAVLPQLVQFSGIANPLVGQIQANVPNLQQHVERLDQQLPLQDQQPMQSHHIKLERISEPLLDVREIHPSSPLASTIQDLINQLEN